MAMSGFKAARLRRIGDVESLVALLGDADARTRSQAEKALGKMLKQEQYADRLINFLGHEMGDSQSAVADLIAQCPGVRARVVDRAFAVVTNQDSLKPKDRHEPLSSDRQGERS